MAADLANITRQFQDSTVRNTLAVSNLHEAKIGFQVWCHEYRGDNERSEVVALPRLVDSDAWTMFDGWFDHHWCEQKRAVKRDTLPEPGTTVNVLESCMTRVYTEVARWTRSGDRPSPRDGRKVRTPRARRWVTPRRSDPTPAPQKTNRQWSERAQARVKWRGKSPPHSW